MTSLKAWSLQIVDAIKQPYKVCPVTNYKWRDMGAPKSRVIIKL